ncbi:putative metallo-beta-lactamase superfamily [Trypanosoma rangeli]|uniref:Putative metallo-beta-lactamase superfamily n=1 Tax=Trypanosoma rangeli TaxID=5698 RepID=A0A3R7KP94_TRYRA|nr:putative metallo-beta-lactamase superfamily [Trypanosoma rangeli]RNF12732.1 putative metallo-beta-lactamase superfamily [Trypanosoma rangeli]|eukprot:RNF12732.1 putative metallo-beta-lactamase superfamily [Trypanosoma rangeli]
MVCLCHLYSRIFDVSDMFVSIRGIFFLQLPHDFEWAYNRTLHRLRSLSTHCALLAHERSMDVEERCGSWNALVDKVVHHFESPAKKNFRLECVRCLITARRSVFLGGDL